MPRYRLIMGPIHINVCSHDPWIMGGPDPSDPLDPPLQWSDRLIPTAQINLHLAYKWMGD